MNNRVLEDYFGHSGSHELKSFQVRLFKIDGKTQINVVAVVSKVKLFQNQVKISADSPHSVVHQEKETIN